MCVTVDALSINQLTPNFDHATLEVISLPVADCDIEWVEQLSLIANF